MSISGDYDIGVSEEAFTTTLGDLRETIDKDVVVRTVDVMIKFQTREPGALWGETLKDRVSAESKTYSITRSDIPTDTELLARLQGAAARSAGSADAKLAISMIQAGIEQLSLVDPNKYPASLEFLRQLVERESARDLLKAVKVYQFIMTAHLPDNNPEKIQAEEFLRLTLESPIAQALLLSIRQELKEGDPIDLFQQIRTYLLKAAPLAIEFLENEARKKKEYEETLQLPLDSEKVQALIAPSRNQALKEAQEREIRKVFECYARALSEMKATPGEKQLSSIDIKITYVKRANPKQELVYEKNYSHQPRTASAARSA